MSDVCKQPELEAAWVALHKASCILGAIYQPMLESGEQASLGVTLEIADELIGTAMETMRKFHASD